MSSKQKPLQNKQKQRDMKNIPHLKGIKMESKYPKFLEDFAEENELEIVDVVEDSHKGSPALFAIFFSDEYGRETRRIDEEEEIVFKY